MSFVVVLVVATLVFFYVSSTRKARRQWLGKLDLPGRWHWQQGNGVLVLTGQAGKGEFEFRDQGVVKRGRWQVHGHFLHLAHIKEDSRPVNLEEKFDLHFFKPGNIGLEDGDGIRRVFVKETSNVVPLKSH